MSGLDDLVKGVTGGKGGGLGDLLGSLAGGASAGGGLEDIIGGLTGGELGEQAGGMGGLLGSLLPALGGMLAGGGLQQVLSGFQANGLSAQTDSWIGTGENEPISGADVRKVVGDEELAKIAAQLGVSGGRGCRRGRTGSTDGGRQGVARGAPCAGERARVGVRGARAPRRRAGDGLKPAPRHHGARLTACRRGCGAAPLRHRNSPRATVTACPPTSTRSIRPPLPSARA